MIHLIPGVSCHIGILQVIAQFGQRCETFFIKAPKLPSILSNRHETRPFSVHVSEPIVLSPLQESKLLAVNLISTRFTG